MYDRKKAVEYAYIWWNKRNPDFFDFENLGGDCTNFVSQCLFFGGIEMNFSYLGWFYESLNFRSPSWAGVEEFFDFATKNKGLGLRSKQTFIDKIEVGDVVQLQLKNEMRFHHTLLVTKIENMPSHKTIFVTAHSSNVKDKSLLSYNFENVRFLKILN